MNKIVNIHQNNNMKKNFYEYFIPILLLCIISIFCIYNRKSIVNNYDEYLIKQILFIIIGIILLFIFKKINYNYLKKYSLILYTISMFLLIYVLIFGNVINGSKSWINILGFSLQPSEFAKITLLICIDKYIETKYGLLKSILLLLIPSILTFLQPDTGTVLFYIIIFFSIFISIKLNKKIYITLSFIILVSCITYFYLYYFKSELFIKFFGTSFFYRTDRIINFINNSGYQLNNALIGIGNGKIFGNLNKYVIYVPESITDFMFASLLTMFGFFGGLITLIIFTIINIRLIKDIKYYNKHKYFIVGLFGLFFYQQVQHIGMNLGILPITGITLPFISYGGSSLISYFILFGILLNIKKYQVDT